MKLHRIFLMLLPILCFGPLASGENIFEPWLNDDQPPIVEIMSVEHKGDIETTRLKFLSRSLPNDGGDVTIYGVLARPLSLGPHPAILVCHGGGGYADGVASQVEAWAHRGYVSFCQDQPGICRISKCHSDGPWRAEHWGSFAMRESDPRTSALFDGVVAALNGLRMLRSREDVDKSRVGVWGGSWGGYMTTMVAGLVGERARAAFAVFGCGFYDKASAWRASLLRMSEADREAWLTHLDAGRRASGIRASYFSCAAANDWFFWPGAVMATLAEIPGEKNQVFGPNDSHHVRLPGGTSGPPRVDTRKNRTNMEILWFAHYLKGEEQAFPVACPSAEPVATPEGIGVDWTVDGPAPITHTWVCYAPADTPWRLRWWKTVEGQAAGDGRYRAVIPVEDAGVGLDWYALATDERNITVSTLITTVLPAQLGFDPADVTPDSFDDNLEGPDIRRRWRRKYADRSEGTARYVNTVRRSLTKSLHIEGPVRWCKWGVRGRALEQSGALGIAFWARSGKDEPVTGLDLLLVGEDEAGSRVVFDCPKVRDAQIGVEWRQLQARWEDFRYAGKGDAPIGLLSSSIGQLRFDTTGAEDIDVYVDDVSLVR